VLAFIYDVFYSNKLIYAEVVTHLAGCLEAGGLPEYPESLLVEINVIKS
jgi:hypothetical protein